MTRYLIAALSTLALALPATAQAKHHRCHRHHHHACKHHAKPRPQLHVGKAYGPVVVQPPQPQPTSTSASYSFDSWGTSPDGSPVPSEADEAEAVYDEAVAEENDAGEIVYEGEVVEVVTEPEA